jgi:peptidoglycan L-alanyl-D-glutamate endopeptidase CwlK
MTYSFGAKSLSKMAGLHPDLKKVLYRAIQLTEVDFSIIEGLRTLERQKQLVASGASKTLNSRHLDGHAVDIAPYVNGEIRWDWPLYNKLAKAMKAAAKEVGVPIEWGGDWLRFKDGPHWQLPWKQYP